MIEGVTRQVRALYDIATALEAMFPGGRFTPDGHMVGSIGEVLAAYIFDLVLAPASQKSWDATRRSHPHETVQIKATGAKTKSAVTSCRQVTPTSPCGMSHYDFVVTISL